MPPALPRNFPAVEARSRLWNLSHQESEILRQEFNEPNLQKLLGKTAPKRSYLA